MVWNTFKFIIKNTRTDVVEKVFNVIDVIRNVIIIVLVFLLLNLNISHLFLLFLLLT